MKEVLKALTKKQKHWTLAVAALAFTIASGCTTGSEKISEERNIFETTSEKIVVQRIDDKEPLISPFGKNHWMDARNTTTASIKRIHALLATGEFQAAEKDARRFLAANPGNLEGMTALSSALAQGSQYDLAAYYAKLIAKALPDNPHSLNILGISVLINATRIEDFRLAENYFKRAFDGSPSEIAAGLNLGDLYLEIGNSDLALQAFDTVRSRCHDCVPALVGFGVASRRIGHYSDALSAFNTVLNIDRSDVETMYQIALVYKDGLKDRTKAEESLRRLLATNSNKSSVKERAETVLRSMLSETNPGKAETANSEKEKGGDVNNDRPSDDFDLINED